MQPSLCSHLPPRLQRSRQRGAKTPPGAIYVGRPTLRGNPFQVARFGHARSVILHRRWLWNELPHPRLLALGFNEGEAEALRRLRLRLLHSLPALAGHPLQCWCALTTPWCHAETLLTVANTPAQLAKLVGHDL